MRPRNQVNDEYLKVCAKYGIESYRGNAKKFFNETSSTLSEMKQRICRLLDTYINIGGYTAVEYSKISTSKDVINIPASRIIRPYSPKLKFMEGLRLRRVKREMEEAAKKGKLYHLWWHPHNFGHHMDENFGFLEEILKFYSVCH